MNFAIFTSSRPLFTQKRPPRPTTITPNQTKRLDGSLETAAREDGNDEEGKEDEGNYTRW